MIAVDGRIFVEMRGGLHRFARVAPAVGGFEAENLDALDCCRVAVNFAAGWCVRLERGSVKTVALSLDACLFRSFGVGRYGGQRAQASEPERHSQRIQAAESPLREMVITVRLYLADSFRKYFFVRAPRLAITAGETLHGYPMSDGDFSDVKRAGFLFGELRFTAFTSNFTNRLTIAHLIES